MFDIKPDSIEELIERLTPEIVETLKSAVELGKWESGDPLSKEQREYCLQAIIAWEDINLEPHLRVGYIERKGSVSGSREGLSNKTMLATDGDQADARAAEKET